MANPGESYQPLAAFDHWLFDSANRVVGIRNPRASPYGPDARFIPSLTTWANRGSASVAGAGTRVIATDLGRSEFFSDGTNWLPVNGRVTIYAAGGGTTTLPIGVANTGTNTLIGVTGGAPRIPAGLIIPGRTILRVTTFLQKTAGSSAMNFDIRLGTTSGFGDAQIGQFTGASSGSCWNAQLDIGFPTTTRAHIANPSALAVNVGTTSSLSDGEQTLSINTALDMFVNVGFNGATPGDALTCSRLMVELFT